MTIVSKNEGEVTLTLSAIEMADLVSNLAIASTIPRLNGTISDAIVSKEFCETADGFFGISGIAMFENIAGSFRAKRN